MQPLPPSTPALVTGASSGIGEEFARQLAARGHDVVLVARRAERLRRLATALRRQHSVGAEVLVADLETEDGRDRVAERIRAGGPWVLVNNAGFGARGPMGTDPAREQALVQVNIVALHRLMLEALRVNLDAGGGAIVNVASTAAFQPLPHLATYAASKAFVLSLSEGVWAECRGRGVRVLALCPGPTRSEFGESMGHPREFEAVRPMATDRCVRSALAALERGDAVCIPGALNTAGAVAVRLVPRTVLRRVLEPVLRPRLG